MKCILSVAGWLLLCAVATRAQNLNAVLDSIDRQASNFHTVQADFVADLYQKVVDEHDMQKGVMYFRRQGDSTEMAADITEPDKKYVVFTDGIVRYYQPKINQ